MSMLSYERFINDIQQFKYAGKNSGYDFNILDVQSHKFFKLLFYFGSEPEFEDNNITGSGLLAPTWEVVDDITSKDDNTKYPVIYNHNSAWAYLKLNDENERAEKLERFVTLLSDINSKSPWYFSKIGGISEALERKSTEEGKLEIADKTLTITCLPDAFDNRIGTLLELYRDITWSWIHKKEILPANLRKFDMAIYMFESPVDGWNSESMIDSINEYEFKPSYKMIEFHNCEFKYNSIKSGLNELDNQTGFSPTYTIEIVYNDCYEISYNDVMMRTIGDVILTDLVNASKNDDDHNSKAQEDSDIQEYHILERFGEYQGGLLSDLIGQTAGLGTSWLKNKFNRAVLGNLYSFSLTKLKDDVEELLDGNLIKSGMTIAQYAKTIENMNNEGPGTPDRNMFKPESQSASKFDNMQNMFKPEPPETTSVELGNLFDSTQLQMYKSNVLGNIFNKTTIANN